MQVGFITKKQTTLLILHSLKEYITTNPWTFLYGCITILLSGITLFIALKVHREFAINHLKSKQIDHVCEMIEFLNQPGITVMFATITQERGTASSGSGILFNIFELGKYETGDNSQQNLEYEDEVVLFDSGSNQILNVKKYIDHPLTPRKIADELIRFHNPLGYIVKREDPNLQIKNFVEISTGIWKESYMFKDIKNGDLIRPNTDAFMSWLNLKETSKALKNAIGNWLIENGIEENNIREDFKSYD